jgi:hypothetical protein
VRQRIRARLTYANVTATLALIIAVSGGAAYAANTIYSSDIVDDQVFSADVRDDTLTGGGLAGRDLQADSVGTSEARDDSIRSADVRDHTETGGGLTAADLSSSAFAQGDIARGGAGFEIPGDAIQGYEVSPNSLTGYNVSESTLSVANMGCQAGLILGFARIKGDSSMPGSYTSSSTYVDTKRNCSGGTVEVDREGSGIYKVRFNGISTQLALGSVIEGGDNFCTDNFVSVTKLGSFTNASEFYVYSRDNDGDLQDCWVTVAAI